MPRLRKSFLFTIVTAAGLLLSWLADSLGILYDSGGVGSLLFYVGWALQFLVSIAHYVVHALHLPAAHRLASVALGLVFALGLDLELRRAWADKS
jgi:hypothetical protein